jgi:hypothetical protein
LPSCSLLCSATAPGIGKASKVVRVSETMSCPLHDEKMPLCFGFDAMRL